MSLSFLSIHHPKTQAREELSHALSIILMQPNVFFLPEINENFDYNLDNAGI